MGGEDGDGRPHGSLVLQCDCEGESLVGLLAWKRTSRRKNKAEFSEVSSGEKS